MRKIIGMAKKLSRAALDFFRKMGAKGGKIGGAVTAKNRTPEERSEAARKAVNARWAKRK